MMFNEFYPNQLENQRNFWHNLHHRRFVFTFLWLNFIDIVGNSSRITGSMILIILKTYITKTYRIKMFIGGKEMSKLHIE